MAVKSWFWRSIVAGTCGSLVHFLLMYVKSRSGLLPDFQPYLSLQHALGRLVGSDVPAIVPWTLSFVNGATILSILFARINRLLPGRRGAAKGMAFGLIGWLLMGLVFFPAIGLGLFGTGAGSALGPPLLSFVMLQAYSIVLATVYEVLQRAD